MEAVMEVVIMLGEVQLLEPVGVITVVMMDIGQETARLEIGRINVTDVVSEGTERNCHNSPR